MAKNNLNKLEMEHVVRRVESVVKCTNGEIATILNRLRKGTGLTPQRKYKMIQEGSAALLPEKDLVDRRNVHCYKSLYDVLVECFDYPETNTQADNTDRRKIKMKTILVTAQTIDGKVAKYPGHDSDWSGRYDKKYFAKVTKESGVVVMGAKTFEIIGKPLPERLNVVMTTDVKKHNFCGSKELIFTSIHPKLLLKALAYFDYESVCVIGGPTINTLFMKAGLIDEIHVTVSPLIFGTGMSMFTEPIDMPVNFRRTELLEDGSLVLIYYLETLL